MKKKNKTTKLKKYKDLADRQKALQKDKALSKNCKKKLKLVKIAGGRCCKCGYNNSLRALSFHHRDPKEKKFCLNIHSLGKNWEEIIEEFEKCDLLCLNCHAEIEEEKIIIEKEKITNTIVLRKRKNSKKMFKIR